MGLGFIDRDLVATGERRPAVRGWGFWLIQAMFVLAWVGAAILSVASALSRKAVTWPSVWLAVFALVEFFFWRRHWRSR